MTSSRIASAGLYALLLIGSSASRAAEDKPQDTDKHTHEAQMKKHCEEMMKDPNMSKMPPGRSSGHHEQVRGAEAAHEEMKRKPPR